MSKQKRKEGQEKITSDLFGDTYRKNKSTVWGANIEKFCVKTIKSYKKYLNPAISVEEARHRMQIMHAFCSGHWEELHNLLKKIKNSKNKSVSFNLTQFEEEYAASFSLKNNK